MSATLETVLELAGRVGASWVVGSRSSGAGDHLLISKLATLHHPAFLLGESVTRE